MYSNKTQLNAQVLGPFLKRHRIPRPHENKREKLSTFDLHQLLQFPIWIRSPIEHIEEMRDAYDRAKSDIQSIVDRVQKLDSTSTPQVGDTPNSKNKDDIEWRTAALDGQPNTEHYRIRAQYLVARSLFLTIAIFLSGVLRAVTDPFDQDDALKAEAIHLTEQVVELGSNMLSLRPLYSSGIAMTITVAWGADTDLARRKKLEEMITEYRLESLGDGWFTGGTWWQTYLARLKHSAGVAMQLDEPENKDVVAKAVTDPNKTFDEVESEILVTRCTIL